MTSNDGLIPLDNVRKGENRVSEGKKKKKKISIPLPISPNIPRYKNFSRISPHPQFIHSFVLTRWVTTRVAPASEVEGLVGWLVGWLLRPVCPQVFLPRFSPPFSRRETKFKGVWRGLDPGFAISSRRVRSLNATHDSLLHPASKFLTGLRMCMCVCVCHVGCKTNS